jgi:hypothetical protein
MNPEDEMSSWRGQPAAQSIAALPRPDRMALTSAACLILKYGPDLPPALEPALEALRACACGTDLAPEMYDLRTILSHWIGEFQGRVDEIRGDMESLRDTLPEATAEYRAALLRDTPADTSSTPELLRLINAKLDTLLPTGTRG